jgi:hypothetical protein
MSTIMYQLTSGDSASSASATTPSFPQAPGNRDYAEYLAWNGSMRATRLSPAPAAALHPGPDYIAFWDALTTSTIYAAIREQSIHVSLPMNTLATELIALLGDAKAGRANEAAIQQSMGAILATGTFTDCATHWSLADSTGGWSILDEHLRPELMTVRS